MRKRPSPGHAVRKKCGGCDHYQEVSRPKTDYGKVALLTIVIASIGATGGTAIVFWILVFIVWIFTKHYSTNRDSKPQENSSSSQDKSFGTTSTTHDPSQYETAVSSTWWYGVAGGTAFWVLALVLASSMDPLSGSKAIVAQILVLVTSIGLPVAAYFDIKYIRANGEWNPNTIIWVALFTVWVVNIVAGGVYLYRRRKIINKSQYN